MPSFILDLRIYNEARSVSMSREDGKVAAVAEQVSHRSSLQEMVFP